MTTQSLSFSSVVSRDVFQSGSLSDQSCIDLEAYFVAVKTRYEFGEEYPYDLEEMVPTVFTAKQKAVEAMLRDFVEGICYCVKYDIEENKIKYLLSPIGFEHFIFGKSKAVFNMHRFIFREDITKSELTTILNDCERVQKDKITLDNVDYTQNKVNKFMRHARINKYELYVIIFDNQVIKVGKGIKAINRVNEHARQASIFGRKVVDFFIDSDPIISETDLIRFCYQYGSILNGKEYFINLDYDSVVSFVRHRTDNAALEMSVH